MSSIVVFAPRLKRTKSMITLLLGLMLGTVGTDQLAGVQRFTFGQLDLIDGINFIVIVMATFALAELHDAQNAFIAKSHTGNIVVCP